MSDEKLKEIQQQLFFEYGFKVDIYHFESNREIAVVKHGNSFASYNILKSYKY
jgi:hypothetical protein